MPPLRLLLTGATGDIGSAVARRADELGYTLGLVARDPSKLSSLSNTLIGNRHVSIPIDLASANSPKEAIKMFSESVGGVDIVVHCAGIQETNTIKSLTSENIAHTLTINFTSALLLAQAFRDKRIQKNSPAIVFVSSVAALRGHSGESAYAGSKAALSAAARSLAAELSPQGIRVNVVAPGAVKGSMTDGIHQRIGDENFKHLIENHPLGIGRPEDVAEAILFLASPQARWITGETLVVDGGYTAT